MRRRAITASSALMRLEHGIQISDAHILWVPPYTFINTPYTHPHFFFPFVLSKNSTHLALTPRRSSALTTASFCGP